MKHSYVVITIASNGLTYTLTEKGNFVLATNNALKFSSVAKAKANELVNLWVSGFHRNWDGARKVFVKGPRGGIYPIKVQTDDE